MKIEIVKYDIFGFEVLFYVLGVFDEVLMFE